MYYKAMGFLISIVVTLALTLSSLVTATFGFLHISQSVPTGAAGPIQTNVFSASVPQTPEPTVPVASALSATTNKYDSDEIPGTSTTPICPHLTRTLSLGMSGSAVSELQHFLAEDTNIYPEGTVTGYFDSLTAKAVQRFQVKEGIRYSPEVPITDTGYGIVGPQTHAAISLVCSSPSVISTLSSAISPYAPTPGTISGEPYEIDVATYTGYASAQIPWKTITDQSVIQKLYADLYALPPLPPANDCPAWSENSVSTELVFYFNYSPSIDSNINYVDAQYWAGGCNVRIQSGAIFEEASLGNFDAKVEEAVGL